MCKNIRCDVFLFTGFMGWELNSPYIVTRVTTTCRKADRQEPCRYRAIFFRKKKKLEMLLHAIKCTANRNEMQLVHMDQSTDAETP